MEIKHNSYPNGVQSLDFCDEWEQEMTVGVIPPGVYDLGIAERRENITVVFGAVHAKGNVFFPFPRSDNTITFEKGEHIAFFCERHAAYFCTYE